MRPMSVLFPSWLAGGVVPVVLSFLSLSLSAFVAGCGVWSSPCCYRRPPLAVSRCPRHRAYRGRRRHGLPFPVIVVSSPSFIVPRPVPLVPVVVVVRLGASSWSSSFWVPRAVARGSDWGRCCGRPRRRRLLGHSARVVVASL